MSLDVQATENSITYQAFVLDSSKPRVLLRLPLILNQIDKLDFFPLIFHLFSLIQNVSFIRHFLDNFLIFDGMLVFEVVSKIFEYFKHFLAILEIALEYVAFTQYRSEQDRETSGQHSVQTKQKITKLENLLRVESTESCIV